MDAAPADRLLICLFASGPVGEEIHASTLPWKDAYEGPDRDAVLAHDVEAVTRGLNDQLRFTAAVDSRTGAVMLSPARLGWLALSRARVHDTLAADTTP